MTSISLKDVLLYAVEIGWRATLGPDLTPTRLAYRKPGVLLSLEMIKPSSGAEFMFFPFRGGRRLSPPIRQPDLSMTSLKNLADSADEFSWRLDVLRAAMCAYVTAEFEGDPYRVRACNCRHGVRLRFSRKFTAALHQGTSSIPIDLLWRGAIYYCPQELRGNPQVVYMGRVDSAEGIKHYNKIKGDIPWGGEL